MLPKAPLAILLNVASSFVSYLRLLTISEYATKDIMVKADTIFSLYFWIKVFIKHIAVYVKYNLSAVISQKTQWPALRLSVFVICSVRPAFLFSD